MKKLISVFAALALVGSLAAQKGKKPAAKAPAKPAVAAPAIPAMPAAVSAAPAAAGAAKGMGLFIDLRGSYTFSNGTSDTLADGATQTDTAATAVTYKASNSAGFGGGVSIGYDIATNLGLVASYDLRSIKTREWSNTTTVGGGTADTKASQKWTNQVIGLGLRPHVNALGGEVYGGAGFALILPFETTQSAAFSNPTAGWASGVTSSGGMTAQETVKKYNMAYGVYGEVGYKFMFTDMIGLNIGLRAVVATANNIDKTKVVTSTVATANTNVVGVATTTYKESFSTNENTAAAAANSSASSGALAKYETLGITDFAANVGISLKF